VEKDVFKDRRLKYAQGISYFNDILYSFFTNNVKAWGINIKINRIGGNYAKSN